MKESLYYLFVSGLILGAGPCLSFCAPILASFIANYRPSLKQAVFSYLSFASGKLVSYMIIGVISGIFSGIIRSGFFAGYINLTGILLGTLVLAIGILTMIAKEPLTNKYCSFFSKGDLKSSGLLGFLAGFSPCLPFLGVLNYIIMIAQSPLEGLIYTFVFGLGTTISPVILLVALSGKLAGDLSKSTKIKVFIKIISSAVLIFMGIAIILQRLS